MAVCRSRAQCASPTRRRSATRPARASARSVSLSLCPTTTITSAAGAGRPGAARPPVAGMRGPHPHLGRSDLDEPLPLGAPERPRPVEALRRRVGVQREVERPGERGQPGGHGDVEPLPEQVVHDCDRLVLAHVVADHGRARREVVYGENGRRVVDVAGVEPGHRHAGRRDEVRAPPRPRAGRDDDVGLPRQHVLGGRAQPGLDLDAEMAQLADLPRVVAEVGEVRCLAHRPQSTADMISMVRAHIADPAVVAKSRRGEADRARPCIGCNQSCLGRVSNVDMRMACTVNTAAGHEATLSKDLIGTTSTPRSVVVVGAVPRAWKRRAPRGCGATGSRCWRRRTTSAAPHAGLPRRRRGCGTDR